MNLYTDHPTFLPVPHTVSLHGLNAPAKLDYLVSLECVLYLIAFVQAIFPT